MSSAPRSHSRRRSPLRCLVPLAAVACAALGVAPVRADAVLATSGAYRLTQQMVNADIGWNEWLAHHPFTPEERREITAIDMAQFKRNPKWATQSTRSEGASLSQVRRYSPFYQADVRHSDLIAVFSAANGSSAQVTAAEGEAYNRILTGYVKPLIIRREMVGPPAMVTATDAAAGLEAARFFASQFGVAAPTVPQYAALIARMQSDPAHEYSLRIYLSSMEAKWIATQAIWKVSSAATRRSFLARVPVASRHDPFLLARAVPEACELPQGNYTLLYHRDGTPVSRAEAMRTLMLRQQSNQMLYNTFTQGQENMRRQSQEDYERQHYEESVRRR